MFEKWTKTSGPSSREIKPYPFSELNHLTVPIANYLAPWCLRRPVHVARREKYQARAPVNTGSLSTPESGVVPELDEVAVGVVDVEPGPVALCTPEAARTRDHVEATRRRERVEILGLDHQAHVVHVDRVAVDRVAVDRVAVDRVAVGFAVTARRGE